VAFADRCEMIADDRLCNHDSWDYSRGRRHHYDYDYKPKKTVRVMQVANKLQEISNEYSRPTPDIYSLKGKRFTNFR